MRSSIFALAGLVILASGACGGTEAGPADASAPLPSATTEPAPIPDGGTPETSSPSDAGLDFSAVDAIAGRAIGASDGGIPGYSLTIYDRRHALVFKKVYGTFATETRVAVASASKLVSGLVLLRLVDQGKLSLDSTTGDVLGWTGPNATIKLSHLMSFTSGLPREAACILKPAIPLSACVDEIRDTTAVAEPGTRFDYGSTHLHVAARMAEVKTGKPWATIFQDELKAPLGLPPEVVYYTAPRQEVGVQNPLIAGGLRVSVDEYAKILGTAFANGVAPNGTRIVSDASIALQAKAPYPAAIVGYSPIAALGQGLDVRYGLAAWLECATPNEGCAQISSPGAFGFTPWLDRDAGYYAILGMEVERTGEVVGFAVELQHALMPEIRKAFGKP